MKLSVAKVPLLETPANEDFRTNIIQLLAPSAVGQQKEKGQEPSAQGNEPLVGGEVAA